MTNKNARVVIIGGGGAAGRAAIAAAEAGACVTVLVKGRLGKCGATTYGVAEMAAFNAADGAVDPADSPAEHYRDILTAAAGMADPAVARAVAEDAPQALRCLADWGVPFEREGDHYLEIRACFSSRPRSHVIKGHGGPIMRALIEQMKRRDIRVFENVMATHLLVTDGECVGVGLIDRAGTRRVIESRAVVLATGGAAQLFARNLNPPDVCGAGYALGYAAGAELLNLEFMQAGVGICRPIANLLNSWAWLALPKLTNVRGEPFLARYLPAGVTEADVLRHHAAHFPFSSSGQSKYLEIASQSELAAGRGTAEGGVNLDFRAGEPVAAGADFQKMWVITRDYLKRKGVDLSAQPVQVACFGHAINGGVRINARGATTVPGLFAAGEVAGGPHGADRLGGNMLLTCQVLGERAGRAAAERALAAPAWTIPESLSAAEWARISERGARAVPELLSLKKRLQQEAQAKLLVLRHERGLTELLGTIEEIEHRIAESPRTENPDWHVLELQHLLAAGRLMTRAALRRRESRGSHYRSDFPLLNDAAFGYPFVQIQNGDTHEFREFIAGD